MRTISIIFANLKNFILKKTVVFFILIAGLIVCQTAFVYFQSESINRYQSRDEVWQTMINYQMEFNQGDINTISSYLKNELFDSSSLPSIKSLYSYSLIRDKDYILTGAYGKTSGCFVETGKDLSEAEDIKNPVILTSGMLDVNNVFQDKMQKFDILDKQFNVIGTAVSNLTNHKLLMAVGDDRGAIINYNDYIITAKTADFVSIYFEHSLNNNQINLLKSSFEKQFPKDKLIIPVSSLTIHATEIYNKLLILSLAIALCIFNVFALYVYWINYNMKKYITFVICGCSAKMIYSSIVLEIQVLNIAAYIIGLALYNLIIPHLVPYGFEYRGFDIKNALLLFLISIIITFVIIYPTAIKVAKKIPKDLKTI